MWVIIFFFISFFMIYYIINAGIECNEIIDGEIDGLLHKWQVIVQARITCTLPVVRS